MKSRSIKADIAILFILIIALMFPMLSKFYLPDKDVNIQAINQDHYFPTDEWRTSTPEDQGMDSGMLYEMLENIEKNSGIRSVLIIRHGHLVLEGYRAPYNKDAAVNIMSVTKNFMSALTGIAIEEKYIDSVDQNLADLLPDYFTNVDPIKKEIRLSHLLTMSAGFPSVEPYDDQFEWPRSKDWIEHVINLPLETKPGSTFRYSSGMPHIVSAIITKTSSMSTLDFAKKYLFDPVGITIESWAQDPNGIYNGGAYITMTPRNMAKFGYLYLNNGVWNDQQIIPSEWVKVSTEGQIRIPYKDWPVDEYGYLWLVDDDYYLASGWGGQYIIVNPKLDMVTVFTSTNQKEPLDIYEKYICKSAKSNEQLEPNPDDFEKMKKRIEAMAHPKAEFVNPDQKLVEKINGKPFKLEENELGLYSFSLNFDDSGCAFSYTQVNKKGQILESEFPVGSKGEYIITPINYHPTYFEVDTVQFPDYNPGGIEDIFINNKLLLPVDEPDGSEQYSVAFEGNWVDEKTFLMKGIWPIESPFKYLAVFNFDENEVNLMLTATPLDYRVDIEGRLDEE